MSSDQRIFITGLGSISAQGWDASSVAAGYLAGGTRIRSRVLAGKPAPAAFLSDEAEGHIRALVQEKSHYQPLDRTVHLALYATRQAVRAAGWGTGDGLTVLVGSSRGATQLFETYHREFLASGETKTAPLTSPTTTLGNIGTWVAQEVHADGPVTELSSTCSTSLYAVGSGLAWIKSGMTQRVLAGGAEAPLTDFTIAQMRALRIYSTEAEDPFPCRSSQSNAGKKNTMVLGEGACLLTLEGLAPEEIGARAPRAEILGAGFSVEPIRTNTSLSEDGDALYRAMSRALEQAGCREVDLIVTHTPGTALGDRAEFNAIQRLFGEHLPILTSNKWIIGHTLGAAGAFSLEYALHILATQQWLEYPYPVPFANRPRPIRRILVNSVGFGGNAGSLVLAAV